MPPNTVDQFTKITMTLKRRREEAEEVPPKKICNGLIICKEVAEDATERKEGAGTGPQEGGRGASVRRGGARGCIFVVRGAAKSGWWSKIIGQINAKQENLLRLLALRRRQLRQLVAPDHRAAHEEEAEGAAHLQHRDRHVEDVLVFDGGERTVREADRASERGAEGEACAGGAHTRR